MSVQVRNWQSGSACTRRAIQRNSCIPAHDDLWQFKNIAFEKDYSMYTM
jgi:hypothetical protein